MVIACIGDGELYDSKLENCQQATSFDRKILITEESANNHPRELDLARVILLHGLDGS